MENTDLDADFGAVDPPFHIKHIVSPMTGLPSILTPGSVLSIELCAERGLPIDCSSWQVQISKGVRRIKIGEETTTDEGTYYYLTAQLTVLEACYYDDFKYRLLVQIPSDSQVELYDLKMEVDGNVFAHENAVQVIQAFPSQPKFCILTDPHIGFEGYPCIDEPNIDEISIFVSEIEEINNIHPDFVIITGDLVDWSSQNNWQNLMNLLKLFQVPVFALVGNHDYYWDNWWMGYPPLLPPSMRSDPVTLRYYLKHINPCRNYSFDYGPLHAVCLDSGDDALLSAVEAYGSGLYDEDLRWLENDLKGREHSLIFMHHPVTRAGAKDEQKRRDNTGCITNNQRRFMSLCSKYNVAAVFSGHEHTDEHWFEGGVNYYTTPSVTRSREQNGYRFVRLTANGGYHTEVIANGKKPQGSYDL